MASVPLAAVVLGPPPPPNKLLIRSFSLDGLSMFDRSTTCGLPRRPLDEEEEEEDERNAWLLRPLERLLMFIEDSPQSVEIE